VESSSGNAVLLRTGESVQQELERHVHVRTSRRIRNLVVELDAERVVLRGLTDSYYLKQLAQEGVLDLMPDVSLHNAILVNRPM
jgi:hypothetical protein